MELRNETDIEFTDISSEQWREILYSNGNIDCIESPLYLGVSSSTLRIVDAEGNSWIIYKDKIDRIKFQVKDGAPHFIK